jgi:uncharacterized membrane-anchored protein YhcB (DUF1043 family)
MPNTWMLVVGAALTVAGIIIGAVTLYRARANRKMDRAAQREWDEMDRRADRWRADAAEWPPPAPTQGATD